MLKLKGYKEFKKAKLLVSVGDNENAAIHLKQAASLGHGLALYALGTWYLHGVTVRKNFRKAYELFRNSIDADYSGAHYDLGVCYEKGMGCEKDLKKAAYHYETAALYKDTFSYSEVARIYYWGIGVDVDKEKSRKFYYKAARVGDFESAISLLLMYLDGEGGSVNKRGALIWHQKISENVSALNDISKKWWKKNNENILEDITG